MALPYLTADVPGTGGRLRDTPEDFVVEEVPAYEPSGAGEHTYVWIEKRDLATPNAAGAIADALGVRARDVGWAGMKDKRAVTRQWLSLPHPATPEAALALDLPGVKVLAAKRHGNKLKAGHLRGNRFVLRVRGVDGDAAARAAQVLRVLAEPPGALNWYGEQRFGRDGDNASRGRSVLKGELRVHDREKRLLISSVQSELFNDWLRRRVDDGLVRRVIDGDWLEKRASGGQFSTTDPSADEARVASGECVVTGPMFGWKLRAAAEGTTAGLREQAVLDDAQMTLESFRPAGELAFGTRRAIANLVEDARAIAEPPDAMVVSFTLPAGAYATAVLREIMKAETDSWT
ncbi:MAG TPA: tRNA pseudouridine(13) synthase TruD [Kofleriaceae bacterium]|nr:tRNA pseudouridine(13) synthase TruD [Kofleriaceae bacterium]